MPIISSPLYGIGVVAVAVGTALWAYTHRSSAESRTTTTYDTTRFGSPPSNVYRSSTISTTKSSNLPSSSSSDRSRIPVDEEINPLPYKYNNSSSLNELRQERSNEFERSKQYGKKAGEDLQLSGESAIEGIKDESKLLKEESKSLLDRLLHGSSTKSTVTTPISSSKETIDYSSSTGEPSGFFSRFRRHPSSPISSTAPISNYNTSMLSSAELDVMRQEEEANRKKAAAERLAAETAATLAAATSFSEKVAEDQAIAQQLEREAQLLKEAYLTKLNEAREAEKLMKKDEMYRRDTERKGSTLLKQEDQLLREVARAQELVENKKLIAEQTKYKLAEQQYREAELLRRQAENERLRALQQYEKEQEQVEFARKRAQEIDERTRPTMTADEANRRAQALQNEESELSRRLADIDRERRNAINQAKLASDLTNKRSRELLAAQQSVEAHENALRNAAERMKQNELKAQQAIESAKRLENTLPPPNLPVKSNPIVASVNAAGEAYVQREYDSTHSQGTSLGTTVTAKGKSNIEFRNATDEAPGPRGGYNNIRINREIISNNDTKTNINLEESSRNEPHRRINTNGNNTMNE